MSDLGFAAQLAEDLSLEDLQLVLGCSATTCSASAPRWHRPPGTGDDAAFRRAAHALAGAAGAVGAVALEQACRQGMAGTGGLDGLLCGIRAVSDFGAVLGRGYLRHA